MAAIGFSAGRGSCSRSQIVLEFLESLKKEPPNVLLLHLLRSSRVRNRRHVPLEGVGGLRGRKPFCETTDHSSGESPSSALISYDGREGRKKKLHYVELVRRDDVLCTVVPLQRKGGSEANDEKTSSETAFFVEDLDEMYILSSSRIASRHHSRRVRGNRGVSVWATPWSRKA